MIPMPATTGAPNRLPSFLIIGAMKAGTTSLYRDLLSHPGIFMPVDKEPNDLASDEVLTPEGLARYAAKFAAASPGQFCGEASTAYTKRPDIQGCAERARRVLGAEARAIYLMREPVSRIISHHYHCTAWEDMHESIDEAVRRHPMFVNYSLYSMQVAPWLEAFGSRRVCLVRFEDYITERAATVAALGEFLGLPPAEPITPSDEAFNRGGDRRVAAGPFAPVQRSAWYRYLIRPLLPARVRDVLRNRLLPKGPPAQAAPRPDTVDWIIERVGEDAEKLRRMMGRGEPVWDFGAVREQSGCGTAAAASKNHHGAGGSKSDATAAAAAGVGSGRPTMEPRC